MATLPPPFGDETRSRCELQAFRPHRRVPYRAKEAANLAKPNIPKKKPSHGAAPTGHHEQLPRLRRIEGQVRGLQQMIASGRDCLEITQQISAIIHALRRVQSDMLHDHLSALGVAIIAEDLPAEARRDLADEIGKHLKRLR